MAEVMAIMNSWPLTPISTDVGMPQVLSSAMLLTQKASVAPAPPGNFELIPDVGGLILEAMKVGLLVHLATHKEMDRGEI